MTIFIVSDTHFFHDNIVRYCDRPQNHCEIMETAWNNTVGKDDIVVHLGDLAYGRTATLNRVKDLVARLNGRIYLFRGNHDRIFSRRRWLEVIGVSDYVSEHGTTLQLEDYVFVYMHHISAKQTPIHGKKTVYVSHAPIKEHDQLPYFYGHIHNHIDDSIRGTNVSVEVMEYKPWKLETLIERQKLLLKS